MDKETKNNNSDFIETILETTENILETGINHFFSYKEELNQIIEKKKEENKRKELAPMAKNAPGNFVGPLLLILGLVLLGVSLGFMLIFLFLYHKGFLFIILTFLAPLVLSMFLLYFGTLKNSYANTYAIYRKVFKEEPYASIKRLSTRANQSEKKTIHYLTEFTDADLFPQGYFVHNQKYYVLSQGAEELLKQRIRKEKIRKEKEDKIKYLQENYPKTYNDYNQVADSVDIIKNLIEVDSAIKNSKLKLELDTTCDILKQIQTYMLDNPGDIPNLNYFLGYVLPTLIKLLKTYCELKDAKVQTANIVATEQEIESVLQTINVSIENMYNSFYMGTSIDVYGDIQTIQAVMNQHGFAQSEF